MYVHTYSMYMYLLFFMYLFMLGLVKEEVTTESVLKKIRPVKKHLKKVRGN